MGPYQQTPSGKLLKLLDTQVHGSVQVQVFLAISWTGSFYDNNTIITGFAIIPSNNPKKLEKPCITKGQYLAIF